MSRWPRTTVLRSTPLNSRPGPVAPASTTRPPRRASWMAWRAGSGVPADSIPRAAAPRAPAGPRGQPPAPRGPRADQDHPRRAHRASHLDGQATKRTGPDDHDLLAGPELTALH